jgi:hypothetical protein
MLSWIPEHSKEIAVVATSVACAGALIGWYYLSQIPELKEDIVVIFTISCFTAGMVVLYHWMSDDWDWKTRRKPSLLDRPLPILAGFVWPMFMGTWNILLDIPDYLSSKECTSRSSPGYNWVWRDGICYSPTQWKESLCEKHPTYCEQP